MEVGEQGHGQGQLSESASISSQDSLQIHNTNYDLIDPESACGDDRPSQGGDSQEGYIWMPWSDLRNMMRTQEVIHTQVSAMYRQMTRTGTDNRMT
jgi:hypothetical protein